MAESQPFPVRRRVLPRRPFVVASPILLAPIRVASDAAWTLWGGYLLIALGAAIVLASSWTRKGR